MYCCTFNDQQNTKPHKFSSKNDHFRKMHESPAFEKIRTKLILKNNLILDNS